MLFQPRADLALQCAGARQSVVGADDDEVNQALGSALPEVGDFETLAGLLNSCAGAIPQSGDRFFVGGLELTVAQRDDRRVLQVRVARAQTVPPPARG